MSELNIYQRINKIKSEVGKVGKDVTIGTGRNSYKAVSHDAVLNTVNQLMINNGVVAHVIDVKMDVDREKYTALDYQTKAPIEKTRTFTTSTIVQRFVNIDDPTDWLDVHSIGHADDPSDKGAGKAYSYAGKYGFLKLFGLATGENDEARHDYTPKAPTTVQAPKPVAVDPIAVLKQCASLQDLQTVYMGLSQAQRKTSAVIKIKDEMKAKLTNA
jgi:hypothetical protein